MKYKEFQLININHQGTPIVVALIEDTLITQKNTFIHIKGAESSIEHVESISLVNDIGHLASGETFSLSEAQSQIVAASVAIHPQLGILPNKIILQFLIDNKNTVELGVNTFLNESTQWRIRLNSQNRVEPKTYDGNPQDMGKWLLGRIKELNQLYEDELKLEKKKMLGAKLKGYKEVYQYHRTHK